MTQTFKEKKSPNEDTATHHSLETLRADSAGVKKIHTLFSLVVFRKNKYILGAFRAEGTILTFDKTYSDKT